MEVENKMKLLSLRMDAKLPYTLEITKDLILLKPASAASPPGPATLTPGQGTLGLYLYYVDAYRELL